MYIGDKLKTAFAANDSQKAELSILSVFIRRGG
jgi:hypothetical protein